MINTLRVEEKLTYQKPEAQANVVFSDVREPFKSHWNKKLQQ